MLTPRRPEDFDQYLRRDHLRVVVLGPGDQKKKRRDIVASLQECGYTNAAIGEDFIPVKEEPLPATLSKLLPAMDLIIVLNTGASALAEMLTITLRNIDAVKKTMVWTPVNWMPRDMPPDRHVPGDILRQFQNRWGFSAVQLEECSLVDEVVTWTNRFCLVSQLLGKYPILPNPIPPNLFARLEEPGTL